MDRENVIKALERCLICDMSVVATDEAQKAYLECEYTVGLYCGQKKVLHDALKLLKEQEAELSYREAKSVTHTATKLDDATCPSCGNVVGEKIRTGAIGQSVVQVRWDYCRFCGQRLDWESR